MVFSSLASTVVGNSSRARDSAASGSPIKGPCDGLNAELPFCNMQLSVAGRVADLIGRLNMTERLSLMSSDGAEIERLGLPQLRWGTECLHGVVVNDYIDPPGTQPLSGGGLSGGATVFPQPLCTAASFDRRLLGQIGEAIGNEARGMNNGGPSAADSTGYLSCWAPNINIFREHVFIYWCSC